MVILLGMAFFAIVGVSIWAIAWKATQELKTSGYQGLSMYGGSAQQLSDKHELHKLGYAQLLKRRWSSMAVLGFSFKGFVLIGGLPLLYRPAVQFGGLSVIGIALPIIALFSLLAAAALSELASAMPVSGGAGSWAARLSDRKWGLRAGWLGAAGQVSALTLWNTGCAVLLDSILAAKLGYSSSMMSIGLLFAAVVFSQAVLHTWSSHLLDALQELSLWVQLLLVAAVMLGTMWLLWPAVYPPSLLYSFYNAKLDGTVSIHAFMLGGLFIASLFSVFGSTSHRGEEAVEPRIRIPWGMFQGTAYFALSCILLFTIMALYDRFPADSIHLGFINGWPSHLEKGWGSSVIHLAGAAILWACGSQAMTACSRCLFSLGRERAIPFGAVWSAVSFRTHSPIRAVWLSAACTILLMVIVQLADGEQSLQLLIALMLTLLHASYAIPIGLKLFKKTVAPEWRSGPWRLGKWSKPIHAAAFVWLLFTALSASLLLHHAGIAAVAVIMLAASAMEMMTAGK